MKTTIVVVIINTAQRLSTSGQTSKNLISYSFIILVKYNVCNMLKLTTGDNSLEKWLTFRGKTEDLATLVVVSVSLCVSVYSDWLLVLQCGRERAVASIDGC